VQCCYSTPAICRLELDFRMADSESMSLISKSESGINGLESRFKSERRAGC